MTAPAQPTSGSYEQMVSLIDSLELSEFRKNILRQRWLDQVRWMGKSAKKARNWYRFYRLPVVVGGVAIPALITVLLAAGNEDRIPWLFNTETWVIRLAAFVISGLVAIFASIEDNFRFNDRWQRYRRTAELLKTIGWQYLGLTGTFRRYPTHEAAFVPFTERVEDVLNEDVEGYFAVMASGQREQARHEIIA